MAMKELGFETKLIRLVKATLDGTWCRVKVQNDLSDPFAIKEGLKQGDALSCLLFNLALEMAMRRSGIATSRTLVNGVIQALGFADGLDLNLDHIIGLIMDHTMAFTISLTNGLTHSWYINAELKRPAAF